MKIPSLNLTVQKAAETLRRFPVPMLIAVAAASILMYLVDFGHTNLPLLEDLTKACLTLSLALPAFTGLAAMQERYGFKLSMIGGLYILFAVLLTGFYFTIGTNENFKDIVYYLMISLAGHMFVAFAPFLLHHEVNGFWQYNKSLFLNFLTAGLYSVVLFGGLSLAIMAIDQLFEVHINEKTYLRLFIFISTVFNTWFFLSVFPKDVAELQQVDDYPKPLRVFTQFVLLPLITIYLLILYVYSARIILTMNWPQGWVSYLVVGFSTAGILALLLIWPLRDNDRYTWIKAYAKGFFMALFPLVILLFFSIYMRVSQYGITINRYYIILLALWLTGMALYFLLSKKKNIKVIPMSLFFLALISAFGPLSSINVSVKSQMNRMESVAVKNKIWSEGKITPLPAGQKVSNEDAEVIWSTLDYMIDAEGVESIRGITTLDMDTLLKKNGRYTLADAVLSELKIDYTRSGYYASDRLDFHFYSNSYNAPLKVEGYTYQFDINFYVSGNSEEKEVVLDSGNVLLLKLENGKLNVSSKEADSVLFVVDLEPFVKKNYQLHHKEGGVIPQEDMMFEVVSADHKMKLIFHNLNGQMKVDGSVKVLNSFEAAVLFR